MATGKRSDGMFPTNAGNLDEAALLSLTTTFSEIVGVGSAKTCQLDVVADLAADTDTVIVQIRRESGAIENLTLDWGDFKGPAQFTFTAGTYRTSAHFRGFHCTGLRVGLSSTATNIVATAGPVA